MNRTRLDFQKQTLEYFIDVRNINTETAFLQKMDDVFQFPSYFWMSLNSLDDCMMSLEWIEEPHIIIHVVHLDELKQNSFKLYKIVQDCFQTYKNYWQGKTSEKQVEIHL
ncbi:MAG: barstar family protein [Flavobacteriaceae bacterium]|nr:barstar family protein [Flavobacteriaceae bacterium]